MMRLSHTLTRMMAGAAMLSALVACDGGKKQATTTSTSGITTIACDETFENILSQEIDVFEYQYPNASIIPYYMSEKDCIDSLLDFKTKLAVITRKLTPKEVDYLKSRNKPVRQSHIAVDALALIVNPANPITELSVEGIAEILSGKIQRWQDFEPMPAGFDTIRVVFDHNGSSTVAYMRDSLLHGGNFSPNVYAQKTPEGVFEAVAKNRNAIGIIGVSWISADMRNREYTREQLAAAVERNDIDSLTFSSDVKVVPILNTEDMRAYKPYQQYIYDGSYPLYRSIYLISTAPGGSLAQGFNAFVTSFNGQKIIQMTGILPATIHPRMVSVTTAGASGQ